MKGEEVNSPLLRITFDPALTYRNIDEGSLLRSLEWADGQANYPLFIVENSDWVEWFHKESCGTYEESNIIHYAIITPNDCIDILAEFEPKAEWLTK
ncbi:MAG: hypothetical protein D3909_06440 [Candidatus Electrothrix sp. ATG1]|nr:hypothetical protein [Candidatus Electrothrix sp. ATG1]